MIFRDGFHKSILTNHGFLFYMYKYIYFWFFGVCFLTNQFVFGMKLNLAANLVLNWVCPVLSFRERFQLITAAAMCAVAINVLERSAFNAESQYFIPLFNRISWLSAEHPTGNEASNGGCNSGPTGHDFQDNFNIYFLFFTIRTGPFPTCENQEPVRFSNWMPGESLGGFHWTVFIRRENHHSGSQW